MKCDKCGRENLTAQELAVHKKHFHASYQKQVNTLINDTCPDCGASLHYAEGCKHCVSCGFSKCG